MQAIETDMSAAPEASAAFESTPRQDGGALFFRVMLPSGVIAYSRGGLYRRSPEGHFVDDEGAILDATGVEIPENAERLFVTGSGSVLAQADRSPVPQRVGRTHCFVFANPTALHAHGTRNVIATAASGAAEPLQQYRMPDGEALYATPDRSATNRVNQLITRRGQRGTVAAFATVSDTSGRLINFVQ